MKKVVLGLMMAAGVALAADPNPYAKYGEAMKPVPGDLMAVEWQNANDAKIAAATGEDVLAAFVADAESAEKLLAQLKPAYATCPLVLTQIAAVTQWVMLPEPFFLWFWEPSPAAGRKVWVEALEKKAATSGDEYVKTFCRQQLDLCR